VDINQILLQHFYQLLKQGATKIFHFFFWKDVVDSFQPLWNAVSKSCDTELMTRMLCQNTDGLLQICWKV